MDLLLSWLIAPLGLLLACVGLSLLVERLTELSLPWTLRPALGLAVAIVVAQFGTATDATAELTIPAILVLAVIGLLIGRRSGWPRPRVVLLGALVFAVFAAPIVASGEATWAGYIKLDDTATWMGITDHVFEYGRGVGNLEPSTHQAMIAAYLGDSYPIGAFVPPAIMSLVSGQDVAFTMQPAMAFGAAVMALLAFELCRRVLRSRWLAFAIAALSPLAALFVGYALWGGIKEVIAAALLPLIPALVAVAARRDWPRALWAPLAIALAAVAATLGPGGAAWLGTTLLPLLVLAYRAIGAQECWALAWRTAVATLLLVLPVLVGPDGIFNPFASVLTEETELGNLVEPLNPLQAAGIWPGLDFRFDPHLATVTAILSVLVLAAAAVTVGWCLRHWRADRVAFASWAGGAAVGAIAIIVIGSPWVDGKAMATVSPALLAAALLGLALLAERTAFRVEAALVAAVIAGFVLWGGFLAYQGAWLAPREHYTELADIGEEFDGQGPALSTEISGYGPRHFLRKLDAEGATDLRVRQVFLNGGASSVDGQYVDLDDIQPDQLDPYNLLVIRRGPATSRPSAAFTLASATDHYEVWRRAEAPGVLADRLPLGSELDAGAVPDCDDVEALADAAGPGGTLVAGRAPPPVVVDFSAGSIPSDWGLSSASTLQPESDGTATAGADVEGGSYEIWLGGAVFGHAEVLVDGESVASERGALNNQGGMEPLGTIELAPGTHELGLSYSGAGLAPGSAERAYQLGPLTLDPVGPADPGLETLAASDYRRLCGERWDWIEAYG